VGILGGGLIQVQDGRGVDDEEPAPVLLHAQVQAVLLRRVGWSLIVQDLPGERLDRFEPRFDRLK